MGTLKHALGIRKLSRIGYHLPFLYWNIDLINWNTLWEQQIKPIEIGDAIYIYPSTTLTQIVLINWLSILRWPWNRLLWYDKNGLIMERCRLKQIVSALDAEQYSVGVCRDAQLLGSGGVDIIAVDSARQWLSKSSKSLLSIESDGFKRWSSLWLHLACEQNTIDKISNHGHTFASRPGTNVLMVCYSMIGSGYNNDDDNWPNVDKRASACGLPALENVTWIMKAYALLEYASAQYAADRAQMASDMISKSRLCKRSARIYRVKPQG